MEVLFILFVVILVVLAILSDYNDYGRTQELINAIDRIGKTIEEIQNEIKVNTMAQEATTPARSPVAGRNEETEVPRPLYV